MQTGKQTIWKLIESCAHELTEIGNTPFTRSDLIKCVRRKNPRYEKNSINPIIQGITDNLRGGALGAVGKDILHSVGRGLFVLRDGISRKRPHARAMAASNTEKKDEHEALRGLEGEYLKIGKYVFHKICDIRPEQDSLGRVLELFPQGRYNNKGNLPLNKYGAGPFCKFKIPNNYNVPGVYALVVDRSTKYIGECENLSYRYNMGYGNISPRNCYAGGQETNCRTNNLILKAAKSGAMISLWFLETEDYKAIEANLRSSENPEWNRV
ncbi:MAG: GIY-YIG nuclease family protein [Deltaproteobacteria bacterium]|nr:GIY-YIG nuclease family protein [Deltaproteobacteria bacterium]